MSAASSADSPASYRCAVCDGPVSLANALLQKGKPLLVCRGFECQRIAGLQATLPPVLFKTQFDFQRQRILARKEQAAARKRHVEAIEQAEAQENERLLQQFLAGNTALADTPAILPLPSGRAGLEPLGESRRQQYRLHLQTIIQQALDCRGVEDLPSDQNTDAHATRLKVEQLLEAQPALQTVSDQLCSQCKGGCCADGADHAYLSVVTIRRQLDAEPGLTADVILQRYLQPLAAESVAETVAETVTETVTDACINQTASGCVLPRELRSDVCNSYYCDSLQKLQREWAAGEAPAAVLVVQRSHTNWNRFEGEGVNPVVGVTWVDLFRSRSD